MPSKATPPPPLTSSDGTTTATTNSRASFHQQPFAAARSTTASKNKQRQPYKFEALKTPPWRPPGLFQIPDIIKTSYLESEKENRFKKKPESPQPPPPPSPPTVHKRPWIHVGRSPSIVPLQPFNRAPKQHAVFEQKMRKVLPRSKVLDMDPRTVYAGMERIGSGANGAVISATKRSSAKRGGQVAIKRCYIEDHDTFHHTFILRELRIMGCMSHPNLVELTEACMWGDYLWMAMELMTCSVFGLLYNVSVGLPESYAVRVALECLEGLVYLHAKNYMHRDVKCENILLSRSGQVKLADFGLAAPLDRENKARLGTNKWMAPEVVSEQPYKENVDIWSLAITMIEMMDRVPPLYYLNGSREIFQEILYGHPPSFQFATPSPGMANLVAWMLEPEKEKRPGAKCVLTRIKEDIQKKTLHCAKPADLGALVREVFPEQPRRKQQQQQQQQQTQEKL